MTETTKKIKHEEADEVLEVTEDVLTHEEEADEDLAIEEVAVADDTAEGKPKRGAKKEKYFEAVGRRKTAVARVRLFTKMEGIKINDKTLKGYFGVERFEKDVESPLDKMKIADKLGAIIKVKGGGPMAQAQAARLGIARALIKFNPVFQKRLRRLDLLTRDPRAVERKKPGLKKARRAPQWKKR
ncbi:MAG: 30S ribosomal protein S9 [Candidatus Wolfebacteria bacterium GW2011_GWE1_48_7]|uniref:30S ribosomal protein S9 n=2 Tax=Candidatus Wolfeibacteriota TaxID=1752735 RepID=A0A0G1WEF1_9BACT|nr:MAG: 30S ribosomal protein S9, small subunit ribosomal protein S9 [Candidatus Wolfebacteria bacterium GW2011_GWB1_47_1]KKU36822.1 MAG: 30S ribosomal protein S9 [Candidatus Wolfebacteria bacterium GW2011_GWC2_46_275]KKU42013.1 MAG: 30S ribosomal protein S9 [Candidatus Wolfebacteria bacterium GW2011_GWB2_46_69]KKU54451.1 MAG: 30S ribosomal protein S9 [Candidatus Wolfebacteria bacterium GW2011_GWC1_47_103]KKU59778.1 MAG: 30S ribosomal protein S9 [Candidatus Wolfebacteria bacterium GW2011_GWE2_4